MFSAAARNQLAWAIAGNDPAKNKTPFPLSSDDLNDHISHTSSGDQFVGFIQSMEKSYDIKNGKKNIAKGTTDPGVKCFHQNNDLKNHAPLLKQCYNLFHKTISLLTLTFQWRQLLEISRQKSMLACLIR